MTALRPAARRLAALCAMFAAVIVVAGGAARAEPVKTEHLELELAPQTRAAVPGSTLYVALHQKIVKGWHTYWRNPGDAGQATQLTWTLPAGWKAGDIVWPTPQRYMTGPLMNYVYADEIYLPVPIEVPAGARPGETVKLSAKADLLVCADVCVPESATVEVSLPVAAGAAELDPRFGEAVSRTLAAAPKPEGLSGAYTLQDGVLKIAVTGAAVAGAEVANAYFYPYGGAAIEHARPQRVERGPDGLTFTIPSAIGFEAKGPLEGVVALDKGAYIVEAQPGPLPAGAAGIGPASVTQGASAAPVATGAAAARPGMGIVTAVAFAFLGGLILNLMPCVFPVLAMKANALARHAEAPGAARGQGLAFAAGVIASFLALAGALIVARAGGEAVGWGFQLQSPLVVAALALLMLLVGLNLSGVFEVGTSVQGAGGGLSRHGGLLGAFFTGALAVVVAAPCTAPFMAGAIGWAVTQPPAATLAVFLALGVGLAAPFTALSFAPGLFRGLPPPGGWMETLRRILAFPMYGAAAWLAWVFAVQAGTPALPFLFAAAIALAFAAWAWGASQRARGPWLPRVAAAVALAAVVGLAATGARMSASPAEAVAAEPAAAGALPTEAWSPERVAALRAEGKPVFVDFTAAWCVTCQVNERTALAGRRVAEAFARTGAVYLKADWTNRNAEIAKALAEQGRSGVPLYLVYGPTGEPTILPQLLTEGVVVQALERAKGA